MDLVTTMYLNENVSNFYNPYIIVWKACPSRTKVSCLGHICLVGQKVSCAGK